MSTQRLCRSLPTNARRRPISVIVSLLALVIPLLGIVVESPAAGQPPGVPKSGVTAVERKIHHRIRTVTKRLRRAGLTAANARQRGAPLLSTRFVKVDEAARLKVLISLANATPATLGRLETLPVEIQIVNRRRKIVQALVPYDSIEQLAALEGVTRIAPPGPKLHRAGSVTSQGDELLNADDVRLLGFDGAGVTVAAMSDGVAGLGASVASGDLPAGTNTSCASASGVDCSCAMAGWGPADGAEGTAMLEIIHDLAPGADLAFGNFDTELEFASVIGCLAAPGRVLVDDIIFLAEPVFEDGIVAEAVDAAVAAGAVYVSAAGNDAGQHVEDVYADIDPDTNDEAFPPTGVDFHDFAVGDASLTVTVNPGGSIIPTLHWNEEYGASAQDYDLYIYDSAFPGALNIIDYGIAPQDGTGDPVEIAFFQNTSASPVTVHVVVDQWAATQANVLKLHLFAVGESVLDTGFLTPEREIYGHTAAAGAIAAGAVPWFNPGTIEPFSSRGPVQILFPTLELRQKPEVVAPDGVSVTGSGGFPSQFFGTSAAAPHAAAVAALLIDRQPAVTPDLVRLALTETALDLGPQGTDVAFGFGRIDALAAVNGLDCGNGTIDAAENCDDTNSAGDDGCDTTCQIEVCFQCEGEPSVCTPEPSSTACEDTDANACTTAGCDGAGVCDQDHICELEGAPCDTDRYCDSACNCVILGCAAAPVAGCVGPEKGILLVKEKTPGSERLKVVLNRLTPAVAQSQFGDPLAGRTGYKVCIYDQNDVLVGEMVVDRVQDDCGTPPEPCWKALSNRGYRYNDNETAADGVQRIITEGGDAGRGKVIVSGKNNPSKGQISLPTGISAALLNNTQATVQVVTSDADCFGVTTDEVKKADGSLFKALGEGSPSAAFLDVAGGLPD